jgi:glycosyltransferase involved in cell wall biosynthesis
MGMGMGMGMGSPAVVAGVILTLNEEHHITAAVQSLARVVDHVLVVDSQSTDATVQLAEAAGAAAVVRPFDDFSQQRNFATDEAVRRWDPAWIVSLDADERIPEALAAELTAVLRSGTSVDVYLLPLRIQFDGRVLRHGGFARSRLPRVYRPTAGRYETRAVNEHFTPAAHARTATMSAPLVHEDVTSWERHIAKHNRYSTLEAEARAHRVAQPGSGVSLRTAVRHPNLRRRWLRERVWDRLPGRPAVRFVQIYVLSLGFLDGRAGFRIALFHAWQEMCTDAKYEALSRQT